MKNNNPLQGIPTPLRLRSHTHTLVKVLLAALLPILVITSCKKDTFRGETTDECPIVVSTDAANGATNIPINRMFTAVFNEAMNASTINNATFTLSNNANIVAGTVSY